VSGSQNFTRNFKILYHRGDDLLFRNPNLHFELDNENDVIKKQSDFIREISGDKSSNLMMILSEKDKRSYIDQDEYLAQESGRKRGLSKVIVDGAFGTDPQPSFQCERISAVTENEFGFKDIGSVQSVSKRFKPTISDLKLLIGTREW
jgi:hypothetical protein